MSNLRVVLALSLASAAFFPRAADAKPPRLGQGAHTYEWVPGWLKLLPGMQIGSTHGDVVIDAKDRVIFSTDTANALYTVSPSGQVLKLWGWPFAGGAHGLRLAREDGREVLWIAHVKRHEVIKTTLDGETLLTLTVPPVQSVQKDGVAVYKDANDFKPTAVDVAPNGEVVVVDGYGKNWLHVYSRSGEHLRSWDGSASGGVGAFKQPHGVGVDRRFPEPRVVVADRQNHRLQVFSLDGKFIEEVKEDLRLPSKIAFFGDDMVVSDLQGRVSIFDKAYKVVAQLGDNSDPELRGKFDVGPDKWKEGELIAPHGAAWDSKGNLFVQDWNVVGRVTKLKRVRGK